MKTIITKKELDVNPTLIGDILNEFPQQERPSKMNWKGLLNIFNGKKLTNSEGGQTWIEGDNLHVDLPYLDLHLPKANS
jgi:hypothetical protein